MSSSPVRVDKPRHCLLCLAALFLIWLYQEMVSPLLRWKGVTCLHYPTCSEYGRLAFTKYPFLHALAITWTRLRDCHPFSGRPYLDYP